MGAFVGLPRILSLRLFVRTVCIEYVHFGLLLASNGESAEDEKSNTFAGIDIPKGPAMTDE